MSATGKFNKYLKFKKKKKVDIQAIQLSNKEKTLTIFTAGCKQC